MATTALSIQIPCEYEDKVFTIKCLKLSASGDTAEKALLECIKSTPYYTGLKSAKVIQFRDFRGRDFTILEVAFSNTVYDGIVENEPFPMETKRKQLKANNSIVEPTPEEIVKLGF